MISEKKSLEIANICYANVSAGFAMFSNPKNRGPNFTWRKWIEHCEEDADLWMMIHNVKGNEKTVKETARRFSREIAERLVSLSIS